MVDDGDVHMKLFESMKKEFRLLRILWRQIYDHVAAVDELNMSVMRLRLRFDDEPLTSQNKLKIKKDNDKKAPDLGKISDNELILTIFGHKQNWIYAGRA